MKKKNMAGKTGKLMISKMTVSNLSKQRARYILGGVEDGTSVCGDTDASTILACSGNSGGVPQSGNFCQPPPSNACSNVNAATCTKKN